DEANDDEALVARNRAVLLDLDLVSRPILAIRVVCLVAGAGTHVLAVERVAACRDAFDDHGLLHLVRDDLADHLAAEPVALLFDGARGGDRIRLLNHRYFASPFSAFAFVVFFAGFSAEAAFGAFAVAALTCAFGAAGFAFFATATFGF